MTRMIPTFRLLPLAALAAALASTACTGTRLLVQPTVEVRTENGTELGASTDYGIVFLGRTAHTGRIEVTSWFGDGPSIESTWIEPVGGGLYTAMTEIRLPSVPMLFREPAAGEKLLVQGFEDDEFWEAEVEVRSDPRVEGILLSIPSELENAPGQTGAGVYWVPDGDRRRMRLVGLVSGRIRLETADGTLAYLTVVGPRSLWRLVAHRRDQDRRPRWVYREDIL